ncbi:Spermidine synthase [Desulfuromonas sp. DDH964]|uniref:spermidine synthase n=1 Tax=Desulfuromonas sp. DDH964 TaxID=1823759 RepID=UPI00078C0050|nr:spermidine synthase [Desulfuromonas sp. DDH964]AMV71764.1 Spermidine synthase [Desulfuromonas sp. DDH964]
MAQPWKTLASVPTAEGLLELRQRGPKDFLILVGGLVLMNSLANRSEIALGQLGCRHLGEHPAPRVLVGGLGMGFTLRAVLDELPATAQVTVAELNPVVVDWCRDPLAPLTAAAVDDPRVTLVIGDVAEAVRKVAKAPSLPRYDAIVFDLYKGPHHRSDAERDPLYGRRAIAAVHAALAPEGRFTVWGENFDAGFDQRLRAAGFVTSHQRPGRGGYRHVVFVASKAPRGGAGGGRR